MECYSNNAPFKINKNMAIIRIFENQTIKINQILETDKTHYLNNVMRCKVGQKIIIINGTNCEFLGEIKHIAKQKIDILIEKQTKEKQIPSFLGLIFSSIQKIDILLKTSIELGVTNFYPFKSQNTQTKCKKDRMINNIIEAVEQSERLDFPTIQKEDSLKNVLENLNNIDNQIFFCEERSDNNNLNSIRVDNNKKNYILIGPEGGFTNEEITLINSYNNVISINLGDKILRTETAAASMLSIINFLKNK